MNVTLIRTTVLLPLGSVTAHQGVPPLALAYLGSTLRKNNHHVFYIDAFGEKINSFSKSPFEGVMVNGLTIPEIIERIPSSTEIIGVSCMFSNEWFYTEELIREIRKHFPHQFIVVGGEHITADYEHILQTNLSIDAAILGEGEEKLKILLEHLEKKLSLSEIPGIAYFDKSKNKVVKNESSGRIKDIDSIPWPDWDGIPLEKYLDLGLGMAAQNKRSYPMLASRGCPYQCTFCSSPQMWTTKWMSRNIDDIIREIEFAKNRYAITHVEFYDLTAIVNKSWIIQFCESLIARKVNVTWSLPSGTRSEALTGEVVRLLKQSGCLKLTYAPESGSVEVLKSIKKKVHLDKMLQSMKHSVREDIIIKANMIFGFPGQTFKDVFYDYVLLLKMAWVGVHDVTCFAFSPYPGSELFNKLLNEKKIVRDSSYNNFLSVNVYNSPLNMKSWSEHIPHFMMPVLTLGGMSFFYSLQFLFRPLRLMKLLKNFFGNKPETMLDLALNGIKEDFIKGRRIKVES